jgi:cyclase
LIAQVAEAVGNQSVVGVLDVKKQRGGNYEIWTHNGRINTGRLATEVALDLERSGVGELVLNSIDNDGRMKGYDLAMVEQIRDVTTVPLTVLGGAGTLNDIGELIRRFGVIGAAAGSLFVFRGIYRAVLINYPSVAERDRLIADCMEMT